MQEDYNVMREYQSFKKRS